MSAALTRLWWQRTVAPAARLLQPLAWLYAGLAEARRSRIEPRRVAGLRVLVVGNLVVGGAGKTPTVLHLVSLLRAAGFRPGVVSRGYGSGDDGVREVDAGSAAAEVGDEPLLIHLRARAPVVVGRDRLAALRELKRRHPQVDVAVSDDGLQHHRMARDLAVIVFDERGAGNGLCLPAGPLRGPMGDAPPPQALVLYNAAEPSTPWPGFVSQRRLGGVLPLADWWAGGSARAEGWASLQGRRVLAAAGVAVPERFFALLESQGLQIDRLPLPDHHAFATLPWPEGTGDVVLTEKDAVKIAPQRAGGSRVWVATLDFQPEPAFDRAVLQALARTPP